MFIDEVEIYVRAGKGGDGVVSFRREKYVPKGGPDGGDGGRGGDVIFRVDDRCHGLASFNREKKFLAEDGKNGGSSNKSGRQGEDLILLVPAGTQVYDHDAILEDLLSEETEIVVAKGGNGGWGNQHFASSIKQAPKWAKEGQKGESKKLRLMLKTIADVGIIGLPNSGKSTLLATLTAARPKIADYPFTTLEPNLGTYIDSDSRIIIADIPGLIEGASAGKGLGIKFLKHVERTKLLLHVVDAFSPDVNNDYQVVRSELGKFSEALLEKPELVLLNKADLLSKPEMTKKIKILSKGGAEVLAVSAISTQGIAVLIERLKNILSRTK